MEKTWIGKKDSNGRKIMCGDWVMWWNGAGKSEETGEWLHLFYALKIKLNKEESCYTMGKLHNSFKGKEVTILSGKEVKKLKDMDCLYPNSFTIKNEEFAKPEPWEECGMSEDNYIKCNDKIAFDIARSLLYSAAEQRKTHFEKIKLNGDNRKWAWIKIGNTKKLCWVDNKTRKAYKADGYEKTWIEIKHFTFIRWATGFDL